jgi:hypothetical protein
VGVSAYFVGHRHRLQLAAYRRNPLDLPTNLARPCNSVRIHAAPLFCAAYRAPLEIVIRQLQVMLVGNPFAVADPVATTCKG